MKVRDIRISYPCFFVFCFFPWSNVYILTDKWLSIKSEFTALYKTERKLLSVFWCWHQGSYSFRTFILVFVPILVIASLWKKLLDGIFPVFRVANPLERFRAGDVTSSYYSVGLGFHPYWLVTSVYSRLWFLDVIYGSFNEYQENIFCHPSNCCISI